MPVSLVGFPDRIAVGGKAVLSATVTAGSGDRVIEYHWYPGDGRAFIATPGSSYQMAYPTAGTYQAYVRVAIRDTKGSVRGEQSNTVPIWVSGVPPPPPGAAAGYIQGVVRSLPNNSPVPGASVSWGGGISSVTNTTTDANGAFRFNNVPAGTQAVTASKSGYFPSSQTVIVPAGGGVNANNLQLRPPTVAPPPVAPPPVAPPGPVQPPTTPPPFTPPVTPPVAPPPAPTPTTGYIQGIVRALPNNAPLAGASVSVGGLSATTDANGVFRINNIFAGVYVVTASASGYLSASQTVTVVAGHGVNANNLQLRPVTPPVTPPVAPPVIPPVTPPILPPPTTPPPFTPPVAPCKVTLIAPAKAVVGTSVSLQAEVNCPPARASDKAVEYHWYPTGEGQLVKTSGSRTSFTYAKAGTYQAYVRVAFRRSDGSVYGEGSNTVSVTVTAATVKPPVIPPVTPPVTPPGDGGTTPPTGGGTDWGSGIGSTIGSASDWVGQNPSIALVVAGAGAVYALGRGWIGGKKRKRR